MNIYNFTDYKVYLNKWIGEAPKKGRGQMRQLALRLNVSTTMISQVLRGDKHFSLEASVDLAEYLGLSESETEYFLMMLELQRAGSYKLRKLFERKLRREQELQQQIQNRIKKDRVLSDSEKMEFYSTWLYSAVRLMSALPSLKHSSDYAKKLNLPLGEVNRILKFLLDNKLCVQEKSRITYGPLRTHVDKDSPFVSKHHQNWRIQGMGKMELKRPNDVFYTHPMALSLEASQEISRRLKDVISEVNTIAGPSDSETLYCLNLDWFQFIESM